MKPALLHLGIILFFTLMSGETHMTLAFQENLQKGKPLEKNLKAGDIHSYRISLKSGDLAYIEVDQRGIDVIVRVFGPTKRKIDEVDSPNGARGIEPV
ncbi:MAG: hypothetical protein HY562_07820, partial [Ignavibacteriales bacterium]|nr:hypothetical protein [Ignavibacteriales bacterium]